MQQLFNFHTTHLIDSMFSNDTSSWTRTNITLIELIENITLAMRHDDFEFVFVDHLSEFDDHLSVTAGNLDKASAILTDLHSRVR